jgi:hypothetical protein
MAEQTSGNGETMRVSLIQAVVNEMNTSTEAKQRAVNLLDDLKGWLIRSLERDVGFNMRLVQAISDNTPQMDTTTLMENEIAKIASKYGANGDEAMTSLKSHGGNRD